MKQVLMSLSENIVLSLARGDDTEEQEAYKSVRGMPRLSQETKDVLSCEKPRGVARER